MRVAWSPNAALALAPLASPTRLRSRPPHPQSYVRCSASAGRTPATLTPQQSPSLPVLPPAGSQAQRTGSILRHERGDGPSALASQRRIIPEVEVERRRATLMIDAPLIVDALSAGPDPPERGRGSARRVRRIPAVTRRDGVRERRGVFPRRGRTTSTRRRRVSSSPSCPPPRSSEAPSRPELFRHVRQRERRAGT